MLLSIPIPVHPALGSVGGGQKVRVEKQINEKEERWSQERNGGEVKMERDREKSDRDVQADSWQKRQK